MDSSIRPIQSQPTRPTAPVRRRREGETAFSVPDEPEPEDTAAEDDRPDRAEERPVAPRPDDEAGSHLDVTA